MSLDVYLYTPVDRAANQTERIYVRRDGQTVEVSRAEWNEMHPGREPVMVALDPDVIGNEVFTANITHNLGRMAAEVLLHGDGYDDLYDVLWRPDEHGLKFARDLIDPLRDGLTSLRETPDYYKQWNPENGWGDYDLLVRFVAGYLSACEEWPDAEIEVSR